EAGAKPVVRVGDEGLEAEGARRGIGGGPDPAHLPDEGLAREGVHPHAHLLSGAERRALALRHVAAALERIVLHQTEHYDAGPDVVPGMDQASGDRAVEGRADGGPVELDAELVAASPGDLERRPDLFVLLRRDHAIGAQRPGAGLVGDGLLKAGLRLAEAR